MAWPQSQDYNEAVQNPQSSFGDSELRGGQAVGNALGIPMPRSGNFADVYEFIGASGQKWAVKCFTRQIPGLQERYSAISKHLLQAKLPFTVDFSYLAKGIRIRGEFYPILKMQWVEGFLLNEFVRDNLDKPALLDALGQIWLRMAKRLREADIAHADLQHGNVILVPGSKASSLSVRLIDYDGMWVPALADQKSGEVGHPAYQHPQRLQQGIYNAGVDRLPLLAIACALRCLAVGGEALWDKYDNGDNLLFREADLRNPKGSGLLKELWKVNNQAGRDLTGYLAVALTSDFDRTPHLGDLMNGSGVRPLFALEAGAKRTPATATPVQPQSKGKTVARVRSQTPVVPASPAFDWTFLNDGGPSSQASPPRMQGSFNKVWLAVALLLLFAITGSSIWVMQKEKPADLSLAGKETMEQDRPNVKADALQPKNETKQLDRPTEQPDLPSAKKESRMPDPPDEESDTAPTKNKLAEAIRPSEAPDSIQNNNDSKEAIRPPLPADKEPIQKKENPEIGAEPTKTSPAQADKIEEKKSEPAPDPFKITSALVKKKLKGKASYDSKTATLSMVYDFKSASQLNDFDLDKTKGALVGAYMQLQPKARVQHNVKFTEVTVVGVVYVPSMRGGVLSTTGGISVSFGGANPDTIYLDARPGNARFIVPAADRLGYKRFGLKILASHVDFAFEKYNVGVATADAQAGFVAFDGGDTGFYYGQLAFSGKMDEDWAQTFFAAPLASTEKNAASTK